MKREENKLKKQPNYRKVLCACVSLFRNEGSIDISGLEFRFTVSARPALRCRREEGEDIHNSRVMLATAQSTARVEVTSASGFAAVVGGSERVVAKVEEPEGSRSAVTRTRSNRQDEFR